MDDIDRDVCELRRALAQGAVQRAYVALVGYMSRLRAGYARERGERAVSGLYQGHFDMTYFALSPDELRERGLKVAVVFDYATFSFQAWLAARNRAVQKSYWEKLRDAGYAEYTLVPQGAGVDAILSVVLAADFSLADEAALTRRIEAGLESFEKDMVAAVGGMSAG
jgi:hypothetical protein